MPDANVVKDAIANVKKINSVMSFPVTFQKLEEYSVDDGRFTKVRIWLMHLGENLNGSVFEKEVVDAALPTLEYIPIVGFIENDLLGEKDFSDHRYIITKNDKGVRRKYVGTAYGVILSNAENNAHYEDRVCDDGEIRTFVVVDGVIWNMFEDSSEIMNRDLIKSHSMELYQDAIGAYEGYEDENGLFHFTKFSYRAACILGNKYEPGMMNSTIEVQFTMSDFVKNLQSEFNDKFSTFTKLVNEKSNQGGIGLMPKTDFAQTVMEQFTDISNMVREHETIRDRWGDDIPRFYLLDIQDNEVIVVDRQNNYSYYGYPFTLNGDKAEIDFANGNRKKVRYENYVEGDVAPENAFNFGKHITEIEDAAFAKIETANQKASEAEADKNTAVTNYESVKADYDEMKPKYDNYVKQEEEREAAALDAQKDAKFAEYEDALAENVDFVALKERKADMTVDEIEKECAVLYVRQNRNKANFSKSNPTTSVVGVMDNDGDDKTGFVETKYGFIPVGR